MTRGHAIGAARRCGGHRCADCGAQYRHAVCQKRPSCPICAKRRAQQQTAWRRKQPSAGEAAFSAHVRLCSLPRPEREFRFCPPRRWRFDFAWPSEKIAVEIEGGTWTNGRHTRGRGFEQDCEKYNEAVLLGWRVLRFPTAAVESGQAAAVVARLLTRRAA